MTKQPQMGEGEKQRNALLQAQAWLERQVAIASGEAEEPSDEDYADVFNAVLALIEDALDEPTGWQPIGTAPRDGSLIDILVINHLHYAKPLERKTNCRWGIVRSWTGVEREDWQGASSDDLEPRYWMRVPDFPAPQGEGT